MYADDTHINYAGSDLHPIESSLSDDLEKLSEWLLSNTLELSDNNVPIEQVFSAKSLGVNVKENLTWHSHINCVKRSLLQLEP